MSKLAIKDRVPRKYDPQVFSDVVRQLEEQINLLSEGRARAYHGALTAAPTLGSWARGDEIKNSEPSVLGPAGSRYVITGWICTTSGSPGTWVEMRTLTGT